MAATGSETIKLNQLKTYIKYISDEDLEAYLHSFNAGSFNITSLNNQLTFSNSYGNADTDGSITITAHFRSALSYSLQLNAGDELFSIPEEYAPDTVVTGSIDSDTTSSNNGIRLDTSGIVTWQGSRLNIYQGYDYLVSIAYSVTVKQSNVTGNEVVTLAQVKKYLGSGGGSSQQLQAVTLFEGRQIGNSYRGLSVDIGESVTNYEYFEITMRDTLGSGGTGTTRLEVTGPTSTTYENSYTAYGVTITATGTSISASRDMYMQYLEITKIVGYKYT